MSYFQQTKIQNSSGTVIDPATSTKQSDGTQKTQIVDGSGNVITSVTDVSGNRHLATAMVQDVIADANNSSTTNLAAGNSYTFTGTITSSLGVAGIQVNLFADKACKIQVQQSMNSTPNWDITDTFYSQASVGFSTTVQATASYLRVVVTTNAETTTAFRLQTALCPVVEAVPRALDKNGNFKTATSMDAYGFSAENTPMGEARCVEPTRLVGTIFEGATIDSRFWTTAAAGTAATIAQANSQVLITSGTSNGATVTMYSTRRGRYISGYSNRYRAVVQASAGVANNVRRWGMGWGASMPTVTDGAWFQMNGAALELVVMKGTTPTTITSFNGQLGATYTLGTSAVTCEIYYTNSKVYFVIGTDILHTHSASTATWANTKAFHAFADSVNSDVIASSETLAVRVASIHRLGPDVSTPQYYNLTGNAATHTLKLGAGTLHRIIFNNTSGTSFIIYDNVTGAAPIIGTITTTSAALGSWSYDCPFFNGLVIVTTGNSLDLTVVYE